VISKEDANHFLEEREIKTIYN